MTALEVLLLAVAGLAAGAVNAAAGGGTLVSFPALLAVGLTPLQANVTSSVGLVSGFVGGSLAYRKELGGQGRRVRRLGVAAAVGGIVGAVLLLTTPAEAFEQIVPFLVLLACALLAVQPLLTRLLAGRDGAQVDRPVALYTVVGLGGVYGSYFGAGLGVMLLAVLGILLAEDLQRINALKGALSGIVNFSGVLVLAFFGPVQWLAALVVAVSALVGGHFGVSVARRIPPTTLRAGIVVLGVAVAIRLLLD